MTKILNEVIKELVKREERGKVKYNKTMDREDLKLIEWLQHLKEELMDSVLYIQKTINIIESELQDGKE